VRLDIIAGKIENESSGLELNTRFVRNFLQSLDRFVQEEIIIPHKMLNSSVIDDFS